MKRVALALQGGGTHGAFVWGVLDRLSQESQLKIMAISGTSSGAFNSAIYLYGLASGGSEGARQVLAEFWTNIANQALWSGNPFIGMSHYGALRNIDSNPLSIWIEQLAPLISPYNFPFFSNPLESVARAVLKDPEKLKHPEPAVFIALADVVNGRREIVTQPNITLPTLLASACLPTNFRAIQIGKSFYWDGGYMGNPTLLPLVRLARDQSGARDIVMVTVNPFRRTDLMPPQSASDIQDRLNELIFNSSLVLEINGIHMVNSLIRRPTKRSRFRTRGNRPYQEILFHRISDDDYMRTLGYVSKANPSLPFLEELRDHGRAAAETWLRTSLSEVGRSSSFDVGALLDEVLPPHLGADLVATGGPLALLPEVTPAESFG
jgi:NTE family protein